MPDHRPVPDAPAPNLRANRSALPGAGRFMLSDQVEHRCQTVDISPTGVALRSPIRGRIGEAVVCYLDRFGRVEGRVARHLADGFAIEFTASAAKRERLAAQLAADDQASSAGAEDLSSVEPERRRAVLRLAAGRQIVVQVMSVTRAGAALTGPVTLALGEAVTLGTRPARVARVVQRLVTVEFDTPLTAAELRPDITL